MYNIWLSHIWTSTRREQRHKQTAGARNDECPHLALTERVKVSAAV